MTALAAYDRTFARPNHTTSRRLKLRRMLQNHYKFRQDEGWSRDIIVLPILRACPSVTRGALGNWLRGANLPVGRRADELAAYLRTIPPLEAVNPPSPAPQLPPAPQPPPPGEADWNRVVDLAADLHRHFNLRAETLDRSVSESMSGLHGRLALIEDALEALRAELAVTGGLNPGALSDRAILAVISRLSKGAGGRRPQGAGGIRKREDGRWEARVDLGMVDGKRTRKSLYGESRQEVEELLDAAERLS